MISGEILYPADVLLLKITNQDGDIFKGEEILGLNCRKGYLGEK